MRRFGFSPHDASARRAKSLSRRWISSRADRFLEREHEPGADRLDDRRRARLLADRWVRVVAVPGRADEHDRAPAGHRRHAAEQEPALGDQHAGRARAAGELVRREEDRVLAGHVDRQVRARGGVVEAGERAVAVEQRRDLLDVGDDPGDVRRGGEAADLQRPVRVLAQLGVEVGEVDPPVRVLADGDDVGARLPPRQLVRVMLVRADEHDRPLGTEVEEPRTSLSIAPVEPEPQNTTTSSVAPARPLGG